MSIGEIILTDCLKECTWQLIERQSAAETRSNGGQVVSWGRPFWLLTARYENLSDQAFRALTAWIARRQGAVVPFTAYRADRPAPVLDPTRVTNSGLGVSAIDIEDSTVSMTGMGTTVISPGDMISFMGAASGRWIGEAIATATPTAGAATISVWPPPQTPHATPAARLYRALGDFQLAGEPTIREPSSRVRSLEFQARQVIRV